MPNTVLDACSAQKEEHGLQWATGTGKMEVEVDDLTGSKKCNHAAVNGGARPHQQGRLDRENDVGVLAEEMGSSQAEEGVNAAKATRQLSKSMTNNFGMKCTDAGFTQDLKTVTPGKLLNFSVPQLSQ